MCDEWDILFKWHNLKLFEFLSQIVYLYKEWDQTYWVLFTGLASEKRTKFSGRLSTSMLLMKFHIYSRVFQLISSQTSYLTRKCNFSYSKTTVLFNRLINLIMTTSPIKIILKYSSKLIQHDKINLFTIISVTLLCIPKCLLY